MNKFLVLAKNKETYFTRRLTEKLGKSVMFFDPWTDSAPEKEIFHSVLVRTTGVYRDDKDLRYLEDHFAGGRCINPLLSLRSFRSKQTQYELLSDLDLPILPWLDLQTVTVPAIQTFIERCLSELYLIKPHRGQGGWGIRVFPPAELLEWFKCNSHERLDLEYLLQPYVQDATEIRFFFIGNWGKCLKRTKAINEVAANFHIKGDAEPIQTPGFVWEIINKVRAKVPLDYGAMDLLVTYSGPLVLEINVVPGIEQLETMFPGLCVITQLYKYIQAY